MSDFVLDEVLLKDIENTEIEYAAYESVWYGFRALSELPENVGSKPNEYRYLYEKYQRLAIECHKFLLRLREIKSARHATASVRGMNTTPDARRGERGRDEIL